MKTSLYVAVVSVLLAVASFARAEVPDAALFQAISEVESHGNPKAVNAAEDAVGLVQIRKICVDDVNRILRHKKYTYADRYDPARSREMFDVYLNYYRENTLRRHGKPESYENLARLWNGGPGNWQTPDAGRYWQRVKREMGR